MNLAAEYERQWQWRDWRPVFDALPPLDGHRILELGCGEGAMAAELVRRGASVVGIDLNPELLAVARARRLDRATFLQQDLSALAPTDLPADGLWSSFAVAYLADPVEALRSWRRALRPGGWAAITEVDDLFAHAPLSPATVELLDAFVADARTAHRYDFRMGHKLATFLEAGGFRVVRVLALQDAELAFQGAAPPAVVQAWADRLDRMKGLQQFSGAVFPALRTEFLDCLRSEAHRSRAQVLCCIALG